MTELELWKRIANHAHKVEGLKITSESPHLISQDYQWRFRVQGEVVAWDTFYPERAHRAAALLVVDAIEKAGLAGFKRNGMKYAGQWSVIDAGSDEKRTDTRPEHLSLLECIAYVLEGLP